MNRGKTIRANVELPCSIRLSGADLRIARGVTEELARESLIVVTPSIAGTGWLKASTSVFVAIELPFTGAFEPRLLECAATISRVRAFSSGVRIAADVQRMRIVSRDPETRTRIRAVTPLCGAEPVPAIERSQNDHPAIRRNRPTNLNSKPTGENTMSFLKNFFVEEDGQDMVEYGLVIALVVVAAAGLLTTFNGKISTAFTTLGTAITGVANF